MVVMDLLSLIISDIGSVFFVDCSFSFLEAVLELVQCPFWFSVH